MAMLNQRPGDGHMATKSIEAKPEAMFPAEALLYILYNAHKLFFLSLTHFNSPRPLLEWELCRPGH